jgi:CHAT domain-containing protein/tetratricopeptide (TPR) repeat protein
MNAVRHVFRSGLLVGFAIALPGVPTIAQTASSKEPQSPVPGLRTLAGDDAQRAAELDRAIAAALKADHWDVAIARAEDLFALRARVQGPLHSKTVDAEWRLDALRQVASRSRDDRIAYQSALTRDEQAEALCAQGKYAQAQPLREKALETYRRLLGDDHPVTANSHKEVVWNLNSQGKYLEAHNRGLRAVKSLDVARLRVASTGLERAGIEPTVRPALAAVLARLGQPAAAWQRLEEDLGRGLLDELAARQDRRLTPAERRRLGELTADLEQLDRLAENTPKDPEQAERARGLAALRRRREPARMAARIALDEFQAKLNQEHGALAGQVARLAEIQATLPADTALVAWVDLPPAGPHAADPDGEHWGVVVRARGIPAWVPIKGTGPDGLWTQDDTALADRVRTELRHRPDAASIDLRPLVERFRAQRLDPMTTALGATVGGLPPARRLIVLPSRAMAGLPVEVLLSADDTRTVSYSPSATVLQYLRLRPRPDRQAGLLALGDPVYPRPAPAAIAANRVLVAERSGGEDFRPLPGTRIEVEALARLFQADHRPTRILLGADASELELDRLATSGELHRFGFLHLATHGVIDEAVPARSAMILTQVGLPDPLQRALLHQPIYDGRLTVREIQRGWALNAELVTLSAGETALGPEAGGEGFVGFTQALLLSGARSLCVSLWKVDDTATALFMPRFYANLLGRRPGLTSPMPKAEALREAKAWLRGLRRAEVPAAIAELSGGAARLEPAQGRQPAGPAATVPAGGDDDRPYAPPHFWAAFVLVGDPG